MCYSGEMTDAPRLLDGRYTIDRTLGRGSMGVVHQGTRLEDQLKVAIKLIHRDLTRDPEVRARFQREIQTSREVEHPGIVRVLDHGAEGDTLFLVMEMLRGRTLGQVAAQEAPVDPARVIEIGRQVALALNAAHEAGLVHRDLKPENVMVCKTEDGGDDVRLLDFGLAIGLDPSKPMGARMTAQGLRLGTPAFMAPEYITTGNLDHRSDLYALGLMLYELACGSLPFKGQGFQLMAHHMSTIPQPLGERVQVPPELGAIVDRLLAKDPDARFQSGAELGAALGAI
jgi:eukaryotic-like serine/threonine-protein kinase